MSRESDELSEERHIESILCTDMDKMVCHAEEGQVLPQGTRWSPDTPDPFLDDDGNLGGTENQHRNRNVTTAGTTCGYPV